MLMSSINDIQCIVNNVEKRRSILSSRVNLCHAVAAVAHSQKGASKSTEVKLTRFGQCSSRGLKLPNLTPKSRCNVDHT